MVGEELPAAPAWVGWAARVVPRLPAGRYRAAAWLGRLARRQFWMRLRIEDAGAWFLCDGNDSIARCVCFTGQYEPQETALLLNFLRPGMTFLDVGANWGYFSLLASCRVGRQGRVVSLEPDPRLFPILEANARRNGLTQLIPLRLAAAAAPGTLTLAGYAPGAENRGVSRIVSGAAGGTAFRVAADSLDDVIARLELAPVDLLKMDIEGAEGLALAGSRRTLGAHRVRRLLLELHPAQLREHGTAPDRVLSYLLDSGYRGWVIDHSPKGNRRARYARRVDPARFLRPFSALGVLDAWPHMLWAAPGLPALDDPDRIPGAG